MKQIIKGVLSILSGKEKYRMAWLILFDLFITVLDIVFLGLILWIVGFYTQANGMAHFSLLPPALANKNSLWLIGSFLLVFSVKNWLGYLSSKAQQNFFYELASGLSERNMANYLKDDYLRFINIDSSVLIYKIGQQPIEFSRYILTPIQQVITQGMLIVFTIGAILLYQPGLFFLLLLLLLPPVMLLGYFIRKKLGNVRANTKSNNQKAIQHLHEAIAGFVESNIYNKHNFFINRYNAYQQQLNNNIAQQQTLQGLSSRLVEIFAILGFFVLLLINKLSAGAPAISLITIGVFMAAAYKIIPGIVKILNSAGQINTYKFTLTDLVPATPPEPATAKPERIESIQFENVAFTYKEQSVLTDFSYAMNAGDFVGISGRSGKGKTTLINILLGFLQQDSGTVYINQKTTTTADRQAYWPRVSYIKQQPFIINDTLKKNITLTDDEPDYSKLEEIITFCGLANVIATHPEGINKALKEHGKNISGGQRQRVMLARALYHDFDVLILDEAFAEIDDVTERDLLQKLQLLAQQGKLIILITHNKASLQFCDKLIVLDEVYA